ncbi:hypothetical protein FACS1894124_5460 [Spirochaetia bacterium]|nr:hypothetical protein FACS1894124_5460 [Spirochaetia bacterium]
MKNGIQLLRQFEESADTMPVQAGIKLLLDLAKRKIVDEAYVVKAIEPRRLRELLHPVIDGVSVKGLKHWNGGIAGSPGAALGRVYFSTASLLEAHSRALRNGEDGRFILALPESFAGDVKAIEAACGVLTARGGYAAHASVVARQYGKVSLVAPDLKIRGKKAVLGDLSFSEGAYITMDVPFCGGSLEQVPLEQAPLEQAPLEQVLLKQVPSVYLGTARLIEPDFAASGLLEFIALTKRVIGTGRRFYIRANADTPRDAALALALGADGIGLCRTEHMFLKADRINIFREMLLAVSADDRNRALKKLQVIQREDFYGILKVMAGKEVTIRLLDAPFHEFMPHSNDELSAYMAHLEKTGNGVTRAELLGRIAALEEFNPMLGRRGCRIAVSYPEIYAMQVQAVFEAVYKLRDEKIDVRLEIMVPMVMNAAELKLIAYGKKIEGASYPGIADVEEAVRRENRAKSGAYKIGAMIELPAAALAAGELAKYGSFFSFGTNDLTQTTLGISRDDFTAFMPDYTRYDLIANPFSVLDGRVKELIATAVERGRLTRPDLVCGLCGEHGANPENVRFCMEAGLDYLSCSPYSAPVALLAAAHVTLAQ